MRKTKRSTKSVFRCEKCEASTYVNKRTTFPVPFPGKQLTLGKVSVRECTQCGFQMPTQRGLEKMARGASVFSSLFLK